MATWKKIIVSGSQAQLAGVTGSFTGSFRGDGSGLTGVVATNPNSLTNGEGISVFNYNGLTAQTVSVSGAADLTNNIVTKWDNTANKFTNSSLTDDGSIISGTTSIQLTGASSKLTGSFNGNLTGTASTASFVSLGAINQNVVITGSLTVSGSASPELFVLGDSQFTGSLSVLGGITSTSQTSSGELVNGNLTVTGNTFLGDAQADRTNITGSVGISGSVVVVGGLSATSLTGSLSASFVSSDLILGTQTKGDYVANITAGNGLASTGATTGENISHTLSVNAGAGISVTAPTSDAVNLDTGSAHFTSGITTQLNSLGVLSGSTQNGAFTFTNASNKFTGSFTGSFTGDGSNLTGIATTLDLSGSNGSGISVNLRTQDLTITGTANEIETSAAGTTLTIGLPNDVTIGNNLSVTTNLTVGGNFTVNGTTTFVNTQDLYVEDQFIVLASGSAGTIDGGIAIDRGTYTSGSVAYGFDSVTERWGYQNGLIDTTNAIVISNPTASAFINYGFTEATHGARTGINGEFLKLGATYIDNAEDIWIFS